MIDLKKYTNADLTTLLVQGNHNLLLKSIKGTGNGYFHIACLRLNDPEEAEEVVQNIFVSLWDRRLSSKSIRP